MTTIKQTKIFTICLLGLLILRVQAGWFSSSSDDDEDKAQTGHREISDVQVLLPISGTPDGRKVSFNLTADNGCYQWEISNSAFVTLHQIPNQHKPQCRNTVTLTANNQKRSTSPIWVSAKDLTSTMVLKSEIKTARLDKLSLLTHAKMIYLNDFTHIHVEGFDENDNLFSSLSGFHFSWTIEDGNSNIKIVPPQNTNARISDGTKEMERQKLSSDTLFIKGVDLGAAKITTKIQEHGYEEVLSADIEVFVVQAFHLIPETTIYMLPSSEFPIRLAEMIFGEREISRHLVNLPSSLYTWTHDQSSIGEIGENGIFYSKDKIGETTVTVFDTRYTPNKAETYVHVVEPAIIDIEIIDITDQVLNGTQISMLTAEKGEKSILEQLNLTDFDSNWMLVDQHYYYLKLELFDKDKNEILLTQNLKFSLNLDTSYFEIKDSNTIQSEYIVKALKPTPDTQKIMVKGSLEEMRSKFDYHMPYLKKLHKEQETRICVQVRINHPTDFVLLPKFIGQLTATGEELKGDVWMLTAKGGSGFYTWRSESFEFATVSGAGLVKAKSVGETMVKVEDQQNEKNAAYIRVEVKPIHSFSWVEEHSEILQGHQGKVALIAHDGQGRKFTNCTSVGVSFQVLNEGIVSLNKDELSPSYVDVQEYVRKQQDVLKLKQLFDEQPNVDYKKDLKVYEFDDSKEELIFHNNFGVCTTRKVFANGEGLGKVQARYTNTQHQSIRIESSVAEVASYQRLKTVEPKQASFYDDLIKYQGSNEEFNKWYQINRIYAAFGSGFSWSLTGGTNFWKDYKGMYSSNVSVIPQTDNGAQEAVQSYKSHVSEAYFKYESTCKIVKNIDKRYAYDFYLDIKQMNEQSRLLLNPAVHELNMTLTCGTPQTSQIMWAQVKNHPEVGDIKKLPRSRQIESNLIHFVLVNTEHTVRVLDFDGDHSFWNHSSIVTTFKSSDESLLTLAPMNNSNQIISNTYPKRQVKTYNDIGEVNITAFADSYKVSQTGESSSSFFSGVTDVSPLGRVDNLEAKMRINVVRNVDIFPKYKSLYLSPYKQNSFTFEIKEGSSFYSVKLNNTELADFVQKENFIILYPKAEGSLEIIVEDIEVPDAKPARAEILLSDIHRLQLDTEGFLIEQGNSLGLFVHAFDYYNQEFDEDQYPFMEFNIEIEKTGVIWALGLEATKNYSDYQSFTATGHEPGVFQVTAYSATWQSIKVPKEYQTKARVTSNMIRIEVFPFLEIRPTNLLLTPNMRYTLTIVGGPSRAPSMTTSSIDIRFDVVDRKIASVGKQREVTAHEVGDTELQYEIVQLANPTQNIAKTIISKRTIPIRVRLVTDIEIPYTNNRQVYKDSMIRMIGVLKYNQEYFTHGLAPISYSWNVTNPSVLQLSLPSKSDMPGGQASVGVLAVNGKVRHNQSGKHENFHTQFNSSSVYSVAQKEGDASIQLLLAIEYPTKYSTEQNWFSTTVTIKIAEKLSVGVPTYMHQSERETTLYLLPRNVLNKIETNKNTKLRLGYSMQSVYDYSAKQYRYEETAQPIIHLKDNQYIQTMDKYGKVTVIIEENSAFNNQVVMLNVLVTDIFNLATKSSYQALSLPLGSSINLPVSFVNEYGHSFANNIEGISVSIEMSHPTVLESEFDFYNSTLILKAKGSGESIVHIFLTNNPNIFDVFKVRVTSVVKPLSPVFLHEGGEVSFKIMDEVLRETDNLIDAGSTVAKKYDARWSTNNPAIMEIHSETGKARALAEGKAEVMLSNHISAASIVHIGKIKYGEVDEYTRANQVFNYSPNGKVHEKRYRIKMYMDGQIEETLPSVQFDGVQLITQNVAFSCVSDLPEIVKAKAIENPLEGYFCIVTVDGKIDVAKKLPKSAKISVFTYPGTNKAQVNNNLVLEFEVRFNTAITVESYYSNRAVDLSSQVRTQKVQLFSNIEFTAAPYRLPNSDILEDHLLKYRVIKAGEGRNEYTLELSVPEEVDQNFQGYIVLTRSDGGEPTKVHVSYKHDGKVMTRPQSINWFTSDAKEVHTNDNSYFREHTSSSGQKYYFLDSVIFFSLMVAVTLLLVSLFSKDSFGRLTGAIPYPRDQRDQREREQRRDQRRDEPRRDIRRPPSQVSMERSANFGGTPSYNQRQSPLQGYGQNVGRNISDSNVMNGQSQFSPAMRPSFGSGYGRNPRIRDPRNAPDSLTDSHLGNLY